MDALPAGFEFRPYIEGPGLYLGNELLAHACPANPDPGAPWRLCIAPRRPPRFEFLPDEAACLRYMARWVLLWEAEIRERIGHAQPPFVNPYTGSGAPSKHPRPRSRRRDRIE